MTDVPSAADVIERAREMKPRLRERAARVEEDRMVGDDTIGEFRDNGFFKILQPRNYGGYEMRPEVLTEVIYEIASACGSSGWVLSVLALHQWEVQHLDDAAIAEIWGSDPAILLSSAYAPTGEVRPAEGGYVLSGRWPFSSGCDHAQWAIVGGIRPPRGPNEPPMLCSFFVPRTEYTIVDDWDTLGLRGTGSKSLVMENVFVPENRQHPIFAGAKPHPGAAPLYQFPFGLMFVEMLAAAVQGMARGVLDLFIEKNRTRIATMDRSSYAENPDVHRYIADTDYTIRAARTLSDANMRAAYDAIERGVEQPMVEKVRHFWESAKSVHACNEASSKVFSMSGAHTILKGDAIQRAFRDMNSATTHMAFNFNGYGRNYGAVRMGQPSTLNLI